MTRCSTVLRPSPHSQNGVTIVGTPRLNRKSRSPIAPVRIWASSELFALLRPSCLSSVLSLKMVSFWWSRSFAGLMVARPFRSLNHLSLHSSSAILFVLVVPPVQVAIVTAASSTAVGLCGPAACRGPLLSLLDWNLWYSLAQVS